MTARLLAGMLLALGLAGCSIPALPTQVPSWVPFIGGPKADPNPVAVPPPAPVAAPLRPGATGPRAPGGEGVMDRVICVVNNDAITQFELDEAEAYFLYESKQAPSEGEARRALRDQLLQRLIDNRLQLQQAEREKITVDDAEMAEQMADVMKRLNVKNDAELEEALRPQGISVDAVKRRIRENLMVQRVIRRKVTLRISVTEQEIDRYLDENRAKLETALTFEARHILLLPEPARGEEGWEEARRRADDVYAKLLAGGDFAELARTNSDDGSAKDGGALGPLKRGELAPEIEAEILKLRPGEASAPFKSGVGYHLFRLDSQQTLTGEGLAQARNQIRDILFREKYQVRFKEWLAEIKQRAMIDVRL